MTSKSLTLLCSAWVKPTRDGDESGRLRHSGWVSLSGAISCDLECETRWHTGWESSEEKAKSCVNVGSNSLNISAKSNKCATTLEAGNVAGQICQTMLLHVPHSNAHYLFVWLCNCARISTSFSISVIFVAVANEFVSFLFASKWKRHTKYHYWWLPDKK